MTDQMIPNEKEEKQSSKLIRFLSEPLSKVGWPTWLVYILAVMGVVYILNPTSGIIELIPDNIPLVGNMDEGVAVMLILAGLVEAVEGRKLRREKKGKVADTLNQNPPGPDTDH